MSEDVASLLTRKSKGVHLIATRVLSCSTGPCDTYGPCLSRTGKSKNSRTPILESRATDSSGGEPACDAELGETAAADEEGPYSHKPKSPFDKILPRSPEHAHTVRLDSATNGARAYNVRPRVGESSHDEPLTEVDTARGAFDLGSTVV